MQLMASIFTIFSNIELYLYHSHLLCFLVEMYYTELLLAQIGPVTFCFGQYIWPSTSHIGQNIECPTLSR